MAKIEIKNHVQEKVDKHGFLPVADMAETIAQAISLIALSDSENAGRFLQVTKNLIPPHRQMDELYNDALGSLRGDPWATRRYINGLDLLSASLPSIDPVEAHKVHNEKRKAKRDLSHIHQKIIPSDSPIIPSSKSIPLLAAGAMLVSTGLYDKKRLSSTLLQVIRKFENFGKIYKAALSSFGNEIDRSRFISILEGFEDIPNWWDIPNLSHIWDFHEIDWHINCLDATYQAVLDSRHPQSHNIYAPFIINKVVPNKVCPPGMVFIEGLNFGTTAGSIAFRRVDNTEFEVLPTTWTPSLITVMVPESAINLWLKIPVSQIDVCGQTVEIFQPGQVYSDFNSGQAIINSLAVNEVALSPVYLNSEDTLNIVAEIYGADNVQVEIIESGNVIQYFNPVMPNTSLPQYYNLKYTLPLTYSNKTTHLTVKVTASGSCIPAIVTRTLAVILTKDPQLVIEGIEVTQAVQNYKSKEHLMFVNPPAPVDVPDNLLQLVSGKAAWVRVYINSLRTSQFDNGQFSGVTGTLLVEEITTGGFPISTSVLSPVVNTPLIIYSTVQYSQRRGDINQTLNFIIPAHLMNGTIKLTARLALTPNSHAILPAPLSLTLNPLITQRLRIVFIPIGYNGPTSPIDNTPLILQPPSLIDLLITLGDTLSIYPVNARPCIRILPAFSFIGTGAIDAGACASPLMNDIVNFAIIDGNREDVIYIGLYNNQMPSISGGCGNSNFNTCIAPSYGPSTIYETTRFGKILAHEIGHAIGRAHAPCGLPFGETPDLNFPSYPPYDSPQNINAVTGEYGGYKKWSYS